MSYREEHEHSFSVNGEHLERVLDALWPRTECLSFGSRSYQLLGQSVATTLHFYSDQTGMELRERLKLSLRNGVVRVARQRKVIAPGRKFEQVVTKALKGRKGVAAVNDFGPIVGAFLKERAKMKYASGADWLKVGIDALVPFDPQHTAYRGDTVHHMELEGSDSHVVADVLASPLFASEIEPYVTGMDIPDTKWILATRYCPEPRRLSFDTPDDLHSYFQRVVRELTPRRVPLEGLQTSSFARSEVLNRLVSTAFPGWVNEPAEKRRPRNGPIR